MAATQATTERKKFRLKAGDEVVVIAGKDKGAKGKIVRVYPKTNRVLVEGVNQAKKHRKPTQGQSGGIDVIDMPIAYSNVLLADPKTGEPTRVGRRKEGDRWVLFAKKSGQTLEATKKKK